MDVFSATFLKCLFKVSGGRSSAAILHLRKAFFSVGYEYIYISTPFLCLEISRRLSSEQKEGQTENPRTQAAEHILHAIRKKYLFALCA